MNEERNWINKGNYSISVTNFPSERANIFGDINVNVSEKLDKVIDELLAGKVIKTKDGNLSKRIGRELSKLRKKEILTISYDSKNQTSYIFLNKSPREVEKKKFGFGGSLRKLIFGR